MKRSQGFTIIELLAVIVVVAVASIVLFSQRADLAATHRDNQRKTAINAMYYNLEEVYFPKHNAYPEHIDSKVLTAMDPALFTDPDGAPLGDQASNYRYEASNCTDGKCQKYSLRSSLEREADFVKSSTDRD